MSEFHWTVPAILTRFRELRGEWLCRDASGGFYWSSSDPHYTFLDVEELKLAQSVHRGMAVTRGGHPRAAKPDPAPPVIRSEPPKESWMLQWEHEHEE